MLVDHLGDRVAQQHNVLIEGLNLTLEFYTIHKVNGYRYVFTTQCVQKRVLEKLPFVVHDIFRVQKFQK